MADITVTQTSTPANSGGTINIAYNYASTVTGTLAGCEPTDWYRYTGTFTTGSQTGATTLNFDLTVPGVPGNSLSHQAQASDTGTAGTWVNCSVGALTITRAVIPPPATVSATTSTTPGASTTITLSATGGSGSYQYSIDGTNYQVSGVFSGITWGSSITIYAKSVYSIYLSTATSAAYTVGYASATIDTEIVLDPTYKDGVIIPATTESVTLTLSSAGANTQYTVWKDGIALSGGATPAVRVGNGTIVLNGNYPTGAGQLPGSGGAASLYADGGSVYEVYARLDPAIGGNPVATGTLVNLTIGVVGPLTSWTMFRKARPPIISSATLNTTFTTLATVTVNAALDSGFGNLEYSSNNSTWQSSSSLTGLTRVTSKSFYAITRGLSTTYNLDSTATTSTAINLFNQPDTAITISGAVLNSTIADTDNNNKVITLTGDSTGTTYRIVRTINSGVTDPTPDILVITEGNDATASTFTLIYGVGDLPTSGTTSTYKVTALVFANSGGQQIESDCAGTTFTIARADLPNAFTFTDVTVVAGTVTTTYVQITGLSGTGTVSRTSGTALWSVSATTTPGTFGTSNTTITSGQYLHLQITAGTAGTTLDTIMSVNGVTDTWSVTAVVSDTTPNAYTFTDVVAAVPSTVYYAFVQITGINTATAVSRTSTTSDGLFAVSSSTTTPATGSFGSTATTILNNQYLHVKMTSSASFSTSVQMIMNVGGVSDTWIITTGASDSNPNGFLNLAGSVTNASLSTNYYATMSTAAAGLTTPGTGYYLNDITIPITVTPVNGSYSTNGTTWLTSAGTVNPLQTVYFRGLSSSLASTVTTHTLTMGTGTSRAFATTTATATALGIGAVSRTPTGDLIGAYNSTIVVSFTGTINQKYKIARTSGTITDLVTGSVLGATGATSLTIPNTTTAIAAEGSTYSYQIYVIKEVAQSGDGIWKIATGTGIGAAFTITRILQPTVADTQTWDTATNTSTINHAVQLKVSGTGGALQYAVSSSATYNTSLIYTWQTDPSFLLTRSSSYYLWARRSTDAGDADGSVLVTVPVYSAPPAYGLQVFASNGATVLLDVTSRIGRSLVKGGPITVNAFSTSSAISVPTLGSSDNSNVVVLFPEATFAQPIIVSVNYGAKTFTITNNTDTQVTDYYYYVVNTGEVV